MDSPIKIQISNPDKTVKLNFKEAVKEMADNIHAHVEFAQMRAQVQRAHYLALVEEGFDITAALVLVK